MIVTFATDANATKKTGINSLEESEKRTFEDECKLCHERPQVVRSGDPQDFVPFTCPTCWKKFNSHQ